MSPSEREIPCDSWCNGLRSSEYGDENGGRRRSESAYEVGSTVQFFCSARTHLSGCCRCETATTAASGGCGVMALSWRVRELLVGLWRGRRSGEEADQGGLVVRRCWRREGAAGGGLSSRRGGRRRLVVVVVRVEGAVEEVLRVDDVVVDGVAGRGCWLEEMGGGAGGGGGVRAEMLAVGGEWSRVRGEVMGGGRDLGTRERGRERERKKSTAER